MHTPFTSVKLRHALVYGKNHPYTSNVPCTKGGERPGEKNRTDYHKFTLPIPHTPILTSTHLDNIISTHPYPGISVDKIVALHGCCLAVGQIAMHTPFTLVKNWDTRISLRKKTSTYIHTYRKSPLRALNTGLALRARQIKHTYYRHCDRSHNPAVRMRAGGNKVRFVGCWPKTKCGQVAMTTWQKGQFLEMSFFTYMSTRMPATL
jgi:hypothetical protein